MNALQYIYIDHTESNLLLQLPLSPWQVQRKEDHYMISVIDFLDTEISIVS